MHRHLRHWFAFFVLALSLACDSSIAPEGATVPGTEATPRHQLAAFRVDRAAEPASFSASVSGRQYFPLQLGGPITGLTLTAHVEFEEPRALVRVVLVDDSKREYLVYEAYPAIEDRNEFDVESVCEETCVLDGVRTAELWVQADGATIDIERLGISRQRTSESPRLRHAAQTAEKVARVNAFARHRRTHWTAGNTSVSALTYAQKRQLLRDPETVDRFLPNLRGFEYYKGGTFNFDGEDEPTWCDLHPGRCTEIDEDYDVTGCTLRTSIDWRNHNGSNFVTPVRDQSLRDPDDYENIIIGCGSCYAFAAIAAMESRFAIQYEKPIISYYLGLDLSEQDVMCRTGGCDGWYTDEVYRVLSYPDPNTCGGYGKPACAPKELFGVMPESCMPYTYTSTSSACSRAAAYANSECQYRWMVKSQIVHHSESKMKTAIANGPLAMSLPTLGHAMAAVGYEDWDCPTGPRTRWIFKNSWGLNFGEFGYVKAVLGADDKELWADSFFDIGNPQPGPVEPYLFTHNSTVHPPCVGGMTQCGSSCVTLTGTNHCGTCNHQCSAGKVCHDGGCCIKTWVPTYGGAGYYKYTNCN